MNGVFISSYGNPCVNWDTLLDWEAMSRDGGYRDELMVRMRSNAKRRDIDDLLVQSTRYEDVYLRDYDTCRCIYCGETIAAVPDSVLAYVKTAGVNPFSESLILEVCSEVFDELISQPWAAGKHIFDPNNSEDDVNV